MKKRLLVLVSVLMLILTGCFGGPVTKTTEEVDESTRIVTVNEEVSEGNFTTYELHYIKDEKLYKTWFSPNFRPALDYLRQNSKPNEKVLTWWDNGHMVRGYAKREPLIYTPNYALLDTVAGGKWDEEKLGEFSTKEDLTNVAYALLADSPTITQGIMKRYGAKWTFVARIDQKKIAGMAQMMDERVSEYLDDLGEPKSGVDHKVLFRMSDGWPVKGFALRYEDDYAFVYELVS
jgi:hypothetical protein